MLQLLCCFSLVAISTLPVIAECLPIPPRFSDFEVRLELVRNFMVGYGFETEVYTCYQESNIKIFSLNWAPKNLLTTSRDLMGWAIAEYDPISNTYQNIQLSNFGSDVIIYINEATNQDLNNFLNYLEESGFEYVSRLEVTWSSKTILTPLFFAQPVEKQVELFIHEGIHNIINNMGLVNLQNKAEIEEAFATVAGYEISIDFFNKQQEYELEENARNNYNWILRLANEVNYIQQQLEDDYDNRDRILNNISQSELNEFFSGEVPNAVLIASWSTYYKHIFAMKDLWNVLYKITR